MMPAREAELRAAIVAEARSWLRTPYAHLACVKGHGVDCARLPIAVYAAVGIIEAFDPGYFPEDYMLHRGEEHYLRFVEQYGRRIESEPQPGDLVITKVGRVYWHGAIVLEWPLGIHARYRGNVELVDMEIDPVMRDRDRLFYSLF